MSILCLRTRLFLKRDFERNKKLQDDRLCVDKSRSVVKFQSWILLREHVSDCVNNIFVGSS